MELVAKTTTILMVFIVVGCPSVCCEYVLLPLVNREADLANSQGEYSEAGKPS